VHGDDDAISGQCGRSDVIRLWWLPPLCWVLITRLDIRLFKAQSYLLLGVIDEPAHFLTSVIVVLAAASVLSLCGRRLATAAVVGVLLAGNLIDADHLPQVMGSEILTVGTPRPYSHSLATVLLLLALAALVHLSRPARKTGGWASTLSAFLAGSALGVVGHLGRDLGTATVSVFWPLTNRAFGYSHGLYLTALLVLSVIPFPCWVTTRILKTTNPFRQDGGSMAIHPKRSLKNPRNTAL
jgi:inner membrane protein